MLSVTDRLMIGDGKRPAHVDGPDQGSLRHTDCRARGVCPWSERGARGRTSFFSELMSGHIARTPDQRRFIPAW
ncbi:hypothetical protein NSU_3204 [Novosphingobium pentaromativorans US6-1]|uniref:Uncharacterized protein n=1 Tax=Novosphingobium pentaromativorans US6-1 TaxID=1088721 RepID=G6EFT3_9SPHN|nr:hypothetical protein NSU_3204 [Novosphingobium pentaromativorans US6-1]